MLGAGEGVRAVWGPYGGLGHRITRLRGLLLQEMTMAGLHELRFTEEKPLLRGQDAELVSVAAEGARLQWRPNLPGLRGEGEGRGRD
uniref:Uncharacterized protein n=1 Tax=Apteryx owenii TaxID=8824 RepID=A0A8B9QWV2_APTOW